MNVLHLSSEKSWRGGEQQIAYLIEELQQHGVKNHVIVRQQTPFEAYCRKKNLPFLSVPFANQFDVGTALKIKTYCRQNRIDLIHAHSSHSHAVSIWAAMLGNTVPIILSRRVDFAVNNNFLSRLKYRHPAVKRVVCVSEKVREIVSPALKSPELAVTVYDGIDLNRFRGSRKSGKLHTEFNLPETMKLIGNVSAIAEQKDYFTFVNTAEILRQEGVEARFFIIGDGPMRAEIEAYVKQKKLTAHIYFTGFRNDVPEILPELDVLLMTSQTEGLGTTILDAFACHVPVVATNAGGIPEIITDGQNGLLANVHDAEKLAAQVTTILNDTLLREKLTRNATTVLQRFRKENMAIQTLEIYKEVLAEN